MRTILANLVGIVVFAGAWALYYRHQGTLHRNWPQVILQTVVWWVLLQVGLRLFPAT